MADANHAFSVAYNPSFRPFQNLLENHLIQVEHSYIKERLSACQPAIKYASTARSVPQNSEPFQREVR